MLSNTDLVEQRIESKRQGLKQLLDKQWLVKILHKLGT